MASAYNGGWDFVKIGAIYQYKEGSFIAMVKILEDNSNDKYYKFKVRVEQANYKPPGSGEFEIINIKENNDYYSGMLQLYKYPAYLCNYSWVRIHI